MTEKEFRKRREELLERAKKLIGSSIFYEGAPRKIEDVGYIGGWGFDFTLKNYHSLCFGEKELSDFLGSGEYRDDITGELVCWLVPSAKDGLTSDVSNDNGSEETDEVVSAETEHTTDIDVWKQRWWDVFFEFVKMGAYSEYSINATSNIIKDAMKEMDNFFKEKVTI